MGGREPEKRELSLLCLPSRESLKTPLRGGGAEGHRLLRPCRRLWKGLMRRVLALAAEERRGFARRRAACLVFSSPLLLLEACT